MDGIKFFPKQSFSNLISDSYHSDITFSAPAKQTSFATSCEADVVELCGQPPKSLSNASQAGNIESFGQKLTSFPFKGPDGKIVKTVACISTDTPNTLMLNFIKGKELAFRTMYDPHTSSFNKVPLEKAVSPEIKQIHKFIDSNLANEMSHQVIDDVSKIKMPYSLKQILINIGKIRL